MVVKCEKFYKLKCVKCNTEYDEHQTATSCTKCGGPLDCIYDYDFIKSRLNMYALKNSPISALKYLDFYPILDLEKIISLKEGGTPLYKANNLGKKYGLNNLYIKSEGSNPTGVFKDRGTLVEVTKALEMNAKAICLASSGNMAASAAAYASKAKLPCYVLVPEGTPIGKLSQTLSYGARVLQIRDTYSTCAKLAEEISKKHKFYLAGDYVFRREGQKSCGYEIIEQLFWKSPDYIICPIGCGTNFSAIWKGIKEFYKLGLINKLPKLIGVQPQGCNTVVKAHNQKKKIQTLKSIDTVCSAVAVNYPLDGQMLLNYIKKSDGNAVAVPDNITLDAEKDLAKYESIFVEASGALPLGALKMLMKKKYFKKDDVIVCIATGNGLKDPITALQNLPSPASMEPQVEEIDRYLQNKLYNLQAVGSKQKTKKVLEKTIPTPKKLQEMIKKTYKITIKEKFLDDIIQELKHFRKKGKLITESDLQKIIENVLKEFSSKNEILSVTDYSLNVFLRDKATANIDIIYNGKKIQSEGEGVGPVDAIINGFKKAIKDKDPLDIKLVDYNVDIHSAGTDAAVEVRIKVKDKKDTYVVGSATSPDIIEASTKAFIRGYNSLYWKNKVKK